MPYISWNFLEINLVPCKLRICKCANISVDDIPICSLFYNLSESFMVQGCQPIFLIVEVICGIESITKQIWICFIWLDKISSFGFREEDILPLSCQEVYFH